MIKRVLTTLALAATIGTALAACNSTPVSTSSPAASFAPMATPAASDELMESPSASGDLPPMESTAPSAS
jgi:hypothetical protein